jgi:hypothetical protein
MNRSYQAKLAAKSTDMKELSRKTAIHEAGHAAAIYLGNKQKNLPPVCFQIIITGVGQNSGLSAPGTQWAAKIDGGRLIHTLPSCIIEATRDFSSKQKQAYIQAFEADMVNLLVGPLAEANYIALRDDEIINSRLVNFNALHNYGGSADIKLVEDYLACLGLTPEAYEQKMAEIFAAAFNFINDRDHWRAIMGLANYILADNKHIIECEEIMSVLDAQLGVRRNAA